MKKILAITLSIILILSSVATASAEQLTVNQTEFTIYALSDDLKDSVVIPDEYPTSAQIITSQTGCTFELVSGDATINIDENGVITMCRKKRYNYSANGIIVSFDTPLNGETPISVTEVMQFGTNTYKVSNGSSYTNITVNLVDYVEAYGEKKLDEYLSGFNLNNMTDYEKLDIACKYVVDFPLNKEIKNGYEMIMFGSGSSGANSEIVVRICEKTGVNSWLRTTRREDDTIYRSAVAEFGGKYYDAFTGYFGTYPRQYTITEYSTPFFYTYVDGGIELNEYIGNPKSEILEIPSEIDGYKVVSVDNLFYASNHNITEIKFPETLKTIKSYAFNYYISLKKVHIPASVENVGIAAFARCEKLTEFTCDENNPYYTIIDNVLFNKDVTKLICAPAIPGNYVLPETVKVIEERAFYGNENIESITTNKALVEIKRFAIADCDKIKRIIIDSPQLKTIREFAIYNNTVQLSSITLPSSVEIIEEYAIGYGNTGKIPFFEIHGELGSSAEEYANENKITFVDVNYKEPEPIKGDANNDGVVTIEDFQEIVKMIASCHITVTQTNDTNSDRDVDLIDALAVKYAVENNDLENISNFGTGEYSEKTAVIDIKTNKKEVEAGEDITIDFVLTEPADIAAIEIVGVFDNSYFENAEITNTYNETNYCELSNNPMGVVCVLNENRENNTIFSAKCKVKQPDELIIAYLVQAVDKNGNYVNVKTNSLLVKQKEIITTTQPNITTPTSPLPTQPTQSTQPTRPSQTNLKGDVDNNGKVNIEDAQEIVKMVGEGIINITDNADANSDGEIDLLDAVAIKSFVDGESTDMKNFGTGKKSDKTAKIDIKVNSSQAKKGDIITVDYVLTEPADIAAINIISTFSDGDCELLEVISSVGETYRTSDNKYAGIVRMFDKNEEDNTIFSVKFKVIDASALISAWVFKAFDRNGNSVDIDVNDVWLDSLTNQSLIGDVNRDGKISVADARKIVVAVANGTQNELIEFGDVNGDNKVSVADARKIVDNIAKNIF